MTDKPALKCWIVSGTDGSGKSSIYHNSSELLGSGELTSGSQSRGLKTTLTFELPKAAIFGLDGTLQDSVALHAIAWQEPMLEFGYDVSFEQARSQLGKGWRQAHSRLPICRRTSRPWQGTGRVARQAFKTEYLPLVRPFTAVPDLPRRVRDAGLRIAVASSAGKDEVDKYPNIARIPDLVDLATSSDDAEESKPAPAIFEVVLKKLKIEGPNAVTIGDTPYDAEAAGKVKIATIGVLCGGFTESSLRQAGCVARYPGPATLFARFAGSLPASKTSELISSLVGAGKASRGQFGRQKD
jgi:phosphoglycolate phosphatase-like HAD superfamily hydrolase